MTDTEGTRLLAEKLMGWKPIEYPESPRIWWDSDELSGKRCWHETLECNWDPRSNIEHAFMLVNKMRERGWDGAIDIMGAGFDCQFHRRVSSGKFDEICRGDANPARAIFLASIAAIEGEKR